MACETAAGTVHRRHPATLLFMIGGTVRSLLIPAVLVLVFARGTSWEYGLLALAGYSILHHLISYWSLRYILSPTDLVIREGIFFCNERHIPYDRIHNVDLVQNPLQRLLGVAEVRLQTASGDEPEAVLSVLSVAVAEQLRENIFIRRQESPGEPLAQAVEPLPVTPEASEPAASNSVASTPTPVSHRVLLKLPVGELVRLGLISCRGFVMFAAFLGVASEFDVFGRFNEQELVQAVTSVEDWAPSLAALAALVFVALVVFILLSIAWPILRFYDYELARRGDDLRIRCGFWPRISVTVPRHRIQLLTIRETIIHRLLGRVSIRVETAGGTGEEEPVSRRWFVPILPPDQLPRILNEIYPELDLDHLDWQPLADKARRRLLVKVSMISLLLAAAGGIVWVPWGAVIGVLAWLVLAPWAWLWVRQATFAVTATGLAYRSGVLTRHTSATMFKKVQVVSLSESPFDRRHEMATLRVDTAGGSVIDHGIHVRYLPKSVALQLMRHTVSRAAASEFQW